VTVACFVRTARTVAGDTSPSIKQSGLAGGRGVLENRSSSWPRVYGRRREVDRMRLGRKTLPERTRLVRFGLPSVSITFWIPSVTSLCVPLPHVY
jgi:hypothetical protein